jgi:hypothetical protein
MAQKAPNSPFSFQTPLADVHLRDDGVLSIVIKPVDSITVEDVKEIVQKVGEHGGGRQFRNLITLPEFVTIGFDIREYSASEDRHKYTIADAFLLNSFAMQVVGNFYINFHKPKKPTKLFTNEEKALKWLREQY